MKILLVHNYYRSDTVGGEDIVYRDEVKLLSQLLGSDQVFNYSTSNDRLSVLRTVFGIWFSWVHFFKVFAMIRQNKIDLVHVHNFFPMLTPSVFLAARLAGAKVVMTLHNYRLSCISGILYRKESGICELCVNRTFPLAGIRYACYRNSRLQSLLAQAAFSFYKTFGMFRAIHQYFALTPFQQQKLVETGLDAKKVVLKPNAVSTLPSHAGIKSGYVYVGRMEEAKGVLTLLQLWQQLPISFQLTLVGSGEHYAEWKTQYEASNIIFMGALTRDETSLVISRSKYLFQLSHMYETFGLTIVEAMSAGTPVIGYDLGTRKDFIQHRVNGFLCAASNLKETVIEADQTSAYGELSASAQKMAMNFVPERVMSQQIDLYRKLLNEGKA